MNDNTLQTKRSSVVLLKCIGLGLQKKYKKVDELKQNVKNL